VQQLPPTLSLQWHFNPAGQFIPYVGAGVNYTTFFSEDTYGDLANFELELDDSFGLALQAGVDFMITEKLLVNFDVRWIDIDSEASLTSGGVPVEKFDVEIDPLTIGVNFGWQF
jgi:outer membrane protein